MIEIEQGLKTGTESDECDCADVKKRKEKKKIRTKTVFSTSAMSDLQTKSYSKFQSET